MSVFCFCRFIFLFLSWFSSGTSTTHHQSSSSSSLQGIFLSFLQIDRELPLFFPSIPIPAPGSASGRIQPHPGFLVPRFRSSALCIPRPAPALPRVVCVMYALL
ncbi:hypothetical protein B0J18DRAFT_428476, partial [Chaetomium sp. MPI-SDFR-AT-0129]